jgi:signal transduction histidine kinase
VINTETPRAATRWLGGAAVMLALLAVLAGSMVLAAQARAAGIVFFGTEPANGILLGCASLISAAIAWWVRASSRMVSRWIMAIALFTLSYQVAFAVGSWLASPLGPRGTLSTLVVLLAICGHMPILALLQLTALRVDTQLSGRRHPVAMTVILGLAATMIVLTFLTFRAPEPVEFLPPLVNAEWTTSGTLALVTQILNEAFLATMFLGPIVLWRSVAKARRATKPRLTIAALSAFMPLCVVTFCGALGLGISFGGMGTEIATYLLLGGFAFAGPLTAAGFAAALHRPEKALRLRSDFIGGTVVVFVGLLFAMVAATISIAVSVFVDGGAAWAIVVITLIAATLLSPLRRRLVRWLTHRADPRRALAATLAQRASHAGTQDAGRTAQDAVREVLADPEAILILSLPGGTGWVAIDDTPVPGPVPGAELVAGSAGEIIACVRPGVDEDTAGIAGAMTELRVLIERAVFDLTVRHQAGRIIAERDRAERAAAAERKRLERDLHDGVQGRLVALALSMQMASSAVDDPLAQQVLGESVRDLRAALDDLRGAAAGRLPDTLVQSGLHAAITEFTSRLPVAVDARIPDGRWEPLVEAVAFFVVTEGITNALKHSGAASISARVRAEGERLRVEVTDNGIGGTEMAGGTGLRGLAERVSAVGGELLVRDGSPGTVLTADLPASLNAAHRDQATLTPAGAGPGAGTVTAR